MGIKERLKKLSFNWHTYTLIAGLGVTYLVFKMATFLMAIGNYGLAKPLLVWGLILLFLTAVTLSIEDKKEA